MPQHHVPTLWIFWSWRKYVCNFLYSHFKAQFAVDIGLMKWGLGLALYYAIGSFHCYSSRPFAHPAIESPMVASTSAVHYLQQLPIHYQAAMPHFLSPPRNFRGLSEYARGEFSNCLKPTTFPFTLHCHQQMQSDSKRILGGPSPSNVGKSRETIADNSPALMR